MQKLYILFFIFTCCLYFSQKLISIDRYGVMTDSADINNVQEKYMIIGTFQKSHDKSETRRAKVLKRENNQWGL